MKLITLKNTQKKNSYPKNFIDRAIKAYLQKQFNIEPPKGSNTVKFNYYKLPYIDHFPKTTKQKLKKICDQYCKDLSVKIVFTPFKVGDLFSVKDAIPKLRNPLLLINLHALAVMPVILVRQLATCQQGSENIWRKRKSYLFLNI